MLPVMDPVSTGSIEDCVLPATMVLRKYWQELPVHAVGLPCYRDVELMDLYKIAHLISVKDVIDNGKDFFNRYWGSELTRAMGFEGTAKYLHDYQPQVMREMLLSRYREIVKSREPVLRRARIEHTYERRHVAYEVLHVPFVASDGVEISQIVSVFDFNLSMQS